jgi:threonine/homoserine/homoserine lactone efflux protein
MRFVGPFTRDVLVHAVTACGIGALLGTSLLAWLAWRAARSAAPVEGPASDDLSED